MIDRHPGYHRAMLAVQSIVTLVTVLGLATGADTVFAARFEIPGNDPSFRSRVYAGATIGQSQLDPETRGTRFASGGSGASATQIRLGIDVHNMLAIELDTSVLGSAGLSLDGETVAGDPNVKYSAASVSALVYGLNGVQLRSRRQGISGYVRLGYGIVKRASNVVPLDGSDTRPILGLGAEYGFDNGLGVRAEVTRFDGDAILLGMGAVYRFGLSPRQIGGVIAQAAEPALRSRDTRVAADGRTFAPGQRGEHTGVRTPVQAAGRQAEAGSPGFVTGPGPATLAARISSSPMNLTQDADGDGVRNADDRCADTPGNTTVATDGCGVLDAVLGEVTFKPGSDFLTARARGDLDRVAKLLLSFPEVPVEIQAHTDNEGPSDANLVLSMKRAEAVVTYLVSQEVNELQMQARGIGENRPISSNATPAGRQRNRRVEMVTLPNLTLAAMSGEAQGPTRQAATPLAVAAQAAAASRASAASYPPPRTTALRTGHQAQRRTTPGIAPLPSPVRIDGLMVDGIVDGLGFPSGSSTLSASARGALTPLVERLDAFPTVRVAVMAHTDSSGSRAANQTLSEARARAVVDHLVTEGVAASRLDAIGYGDTLPRVQNVTPRDRARNRRIEIRVVE